MLQSHLTGRYHLSPSLLYSHVRPPTHQSSNLEVDLVGDFIVIAVLAWKDEPRFRNPNALKADVKEVKPRKRWGGVHDEDEPEEDEEGKDEIYAKQTKRQKTSRYIRLTLVDLSTTQAAASGTGILHMMLFEADEVIETVEEDGYTTRRYKGGSGGAYEKYWKETEGVVVAILNPRVLKPQPVSSLFPPSSEI
jgi:minichromosome maintenance protein 10